MTISEKIGLLGGFPTLLINYNRLLGKVGTDSRHWYMKQAISIHNLFRKKIQINSIKHLEGHGNYSMLYLTDGKPILTSRTIAKMADQLPTFVRIHRKYLINPYFIAPNQLLSYRNLKLILTTGEALPVARRRTAELMTYLTNVGLLATEYTI